MNVWGNASSQRALWLAGFGFGLLPLACGSRSSLEGRRSNSTQASSGGSLNAAGGLGNGGNPFGHPGGPTGGTAETGTGGAGPEGSGGEGIITPILRAPDARLTPPTTCTLDGWCGSLGDYVAIWGSSVFDIYIAANKLKTTGPSTERHPPEESALLHWNGLEWNTIDLPDAANVVLSAIWGSSADDVWVVGTPDLVMHFDGTSWSRALLPVGDPVQLSTVSGTGPTDVWVGGGGLYHFDGNAWSGVSNRLVASIWPTGSDVWVTASGVLTRTRDLGETWLDVPISASWNAVWGNQIGEPFVAGQDGNLGHWTEAGWVVQTVSDSGYQRSFRAVWGIAPTDVWAVGDAGAMAFWEGRDWTPATSPTNANLRGIWGSSRDQMLWAVGEGATFIEIASGSWTSNQPSAHELKAIWGGAPSDVWAVGQDTVHWDGATWTQVADPADFELQCIWGSAPSDVWAVGDVGTILHSDGAEWNFAFSPTTENITGIWGSHASDIWAVGDKGSFLHFDGNRWDIWPTEYFGPLAAVYGNSATDVVAAGVGARIHFDGQSWTRLPDHPTEGPYYLTAFGDGTNVFLGGMVPFNAYKGGGANLELGRWDGSSVFDNLEPAGAGTAVVASGWANGSADVWIAVPMLAHWDGATWNYAATSRDVGVTALGATSEDIWAATTTAQMLRMKRK